ncbi:MAG: hypothetical protein KGL39_47410 [Patescibacteria group bacterium]|nr:hypothetical protein [Patescibacteria group bacterium]
MCRNLKLFSLLLILPLTLAVGCKTSSTSTSPAVLAPGYLNQADQTMGQTLAAAHQFYAKIQADVQAGTYTPSSTERTALDTFAVTLNQAQLEYLAYHNGVATQAQAQAAVNAVSAAQAQLQAAFPAVSVPPGNKAS